MAKVVLRQNASLVLQEELAYPDVIGGNSP